MNLRWKIQLLIMIVITLGLVWGIATKKIFIIPDAPRETNLQESQKDFDDALKGYVLGNTPDKKVLMLKSIFEKHYPWVALTGRYSVDGFTGLDRVEWGATPHLPRATTVGEFASVKNQADRFFGELILATRNAFYAETSHPYIKTTYINTVTIATWTIPVAKELEDLVKNDLLFSTTEDTKVVLVLDRARLDAISTLEDPAEWSKYIAPRPWEMWVPNTGPVAQVKPDVPEGQ